MFTNFVLYKINYCNTVLYCNKMMSYFYEFHLFLLEWYWFPIVFYADRKGLENPKAVETIQDRLIEALKLQICRNHSTEENLFGTTIVKLPQLRTLGVQHDEILEWYRAQWNRVRLPPLFSEIYDISKHEEDMWCLCSTFSGRLHHFYLLCE